jgi:hypothetical protein
MLFCAALVSAEQTGIQIIKLEPTVLFPNAQPLHQVALLDIFNSTGGALRCRLLVQVADSAPELGPVDEIPAGHTTLRALIPDIASPQQVHIEIQDAEGGKVLASITQGWTPQRKWKVYIVESSHEDLGFEDALYKKQRDISNYIDIASRLSDPHQAMGGGDYHYTMETLVFMRNYMEERSEAQWRDLVENHIKNGQMSLMGAPSGVHSHWMDYEELARMTYPAKREVLDRFGLDLKTFMIADNPSISWSAAEVLADAGFRYAARWGHGARGNGNYDYEHTKLPALFWWVAPDGVHKVLFAWRGSYGLSFWYGQQESGYGPHLFDLGSLNLNRALKKIEDGTLLGPYPYDALVQPSYVDHAIPHVDERALPEWGKEFAYPQILISSPTNFFEYIESKYGKDLPVLTGDLNNFSADYATIDPDSQGWKRQAARDLPEAEGLSAIDSYMDPSYQPVGLRAATIWNQIYDYDEHSWPTLPEAADPQLFNAEWIKKLGAKRALRDSDYILDAGMKSLAAQVRADGKRILVFNSLAHERDDIVHVDGICSTVEDLSTHSILPCEPSDTGGSFFIAHAVPAYGYKLYRASAQVAGSATGISITTDGIANQFYTIRFDRHTGNVISIVDKNSGRELVDSNAKYQFNQMIYVHKNGKLLSQGFEYSPMHARLTKARKAQVSVSFDSWTDDAKTGAAIHQTITLYDGIPRIDIVDNLQHARIMFSNNYEERYLENIFYAFPLAVPGGQARAEYPGGVVRPYLDQLRWGSHDYLSADRWVDVSNKDFGVTLALVNTPIVDFGEIRYNQFSLDYKPANSYLFSYAWSNRMAGLLTLDGEDCNATFRYSLTSHSGDWNSGAATRLGWSIASPLHAVTLSANPKGRLDSKETSFLSVDAPNVEITVLKESEQPGKGWIVRLVETEGRSTEFRIKSDFLRITSAYECDLAENDIKRLNVSDRTIRTKILPFGYVTLRLAGSDTPGRIENLRAISPSGERADLQWTGAGIDDRYEIYRSEDPRDPPTEYTLIGTANTREFHDNGLDPDTTYYYRVAAVTKQNIGGPESAQIKVTTRAAASAPPAAVTDLSVIRLSTTRLMLCWRKSSEKDIAHYYVYRSDREDFDPNSAHPLAVLTKNGYFLEFFIDSGLQPGHQYFYKVLPENWSGMRQQTSATAEATTPNE